MKKLVAFAILGMLLYEACLLPIYLWLGPAVFGASAEQVFGRNPNYLLFIVPFSLVFLAGVLMVVKHRGLKIFLALYTVWETLNYAYIFAVFSPGPVNITQNMNFFERLVALAVCIFPMFYVLAPFGVLYWVAVIIVYLVKRKKQPSANPQV
jgi:hypothetical protein